MQTKISVFLNEVFKYVVVFFLLFAWINFYYHHFIASVMIAVLLSAIICYFLTTIYYKKQNKTITSNQDRKKMKELSTQFIFNDLSENLNFFNEVFKRKNIETKLGKYNLILYPNTAHAILFLPYFSLERISESIIVNTYKQLTETNTKKALICCNQANSQAKQLASSLKNAEIVIYEENDIYVHLLKPLNFYPDKKIMFKENKNMNVKLFLNMLVNKRNTKHYFYGGILLLFTSLFIGFGNYYLIFSSVLFILSLLSFYSDKLFTKNSSTIKLEPIIKQR